jgi:hypothetical protein
MAKFNAPQINYKKENHKKIRVKRKAAKLEQVSCCRCPWLNMLRFAAGKSWAQAYLDIATYIT